MLLPGAVLNPKGEHDIRAPGASPVTKASPVRWMPRPILRRETGRTPYTSSARSTRRMSVCSNRPPWRPSVIDHLENIVAGWHGRAQGDRGRLQPRATAPMDSQYDRTAQEQRHPLFAPPGAQDRSHGWSSPQANGTRGWRPPRETQPPRRGGGERHRVPCRVPHPILGWGTNRPNVPIAGCRVPC